MAVASSQSPGSTEEVFDYSVGKEGCISIGSAFLEEDL